MAKRVLVVDDDPKSVKYLSVMLREHGYAVATANNCDEALAEARKHRPDVIALDIHMPRKSGVFFYHRLKADEAFRNVPVVVVTGLTRNDKEMESLIRSLLEPENVPPPEAYLEKPIDPKLFLSTIRAAIDKAACAAEN